MGSTAVPLGKSTDPVWKMSLVWKLLAVIVILQTFGANNNISAKQINTDLTLDDTFDIDGAPPTNAKWRSTRDLEENEMLEDELQPFEENEDDSSWLVKSVKRVRRELGRLLGAADNAAAQPKKKHHKKRSDEQRQRQQSKKNQRQQQQSRNGAAKKHNGHANNNHNNHNAQLKLTKKHAAGKLNRHQKRQSDTEFEDGSGNYGIDDDEDDDEDATNYSTAIYRTLFTINEPWVDGYRQDTNSVEFMELHRQVETAFRDLYSNTYPDDNEDAAFRATLLRVLPTNDNYKIHVIVQLDMYNKDANFENEFRRQIETYHRLGDLGADVDSDYYFRLIEDVNEELDLGETTRQPEANCDINPNGYFMCRDGRLIECYSRCDNQIDCDDGSDEEEEMCRALDENDNEVDRYNGYDDRNVNEVVTENQNENEDDRYNGYDDRNVNENENEDDRYNGYDGRNENEHENEDVPYNGYDGRNENEHENEDVPYNGYDGRNVNEKENEHENENENENNNENETETENDNENDTDYGYGKDTGNDPSYDNEAGYDNENEADLAPTEESTNTYDNGSDHTLRRKENVCEENGLFYCSNYDMIDCNQVCDGIPHCSDHSDESPHICTTDVENEDIAPIDRNDDNNDINNIDNEIDGSGSDGGNNGIGDYTTETSRLYTRPFYGEGCRGDASFTCPHSGVQICDEQLCDGDEQCPDGEDELNCPGIENGEDEDPWSRNVCADNEFRCDDRCLPKDYQCNGVYECADRTDEDNCPEPEVKECQSYEYRCRSGTCIDARKRCNRVPDCPDGDDEDESCLTTRHTPDDCTREQFFCDDECRPMSIRCNGYTDCTDRSDETNCPSQSYTTRRPLITYPCPQHTCPNGKCYSESERCDGSRDCDDGYDELNCCASNQFRCRNGDCVPEYNHCNGYPDCSDGSDEESCSDPAYDNPPARGCSPSQFRCDNGHCINAAAKCDGYTDCADSSDERYCTGNQPSTPAPQLNLKTYPDSQIIKESREVIFRCRDEGPLRANVKWTRAGGRTLPAGFTDRNGRLEIPNIRVEDSGSYICEAVGYPRHVPGQQVTVHLTVERFNPLLDRPPSACRPNQATCMNGECIDKSQICDGMPHCSDGSDEHSCSHGRKCHPNQFMCRNSKCVDRIWRCDGENDCGDNSDEESCDPQPSGAPCRYDEFQCRSGHCIPKSFQCDDTNDCVDGSDEIGCMAPVEIRKLPPHVNLNENESLNLTCVGTGVPVPVVVWRLNWGHVPEKCVSRSHAGTGTLYCPDMKQQDSGAYSCEIINTKGTRFVTPDALVTVTPDQRPDVCPAGFFNMLARSRDECINCFCFGITKSCNSANLYNFAIQPPITSNRVVNVELSPYDDIRVTDAPPSNIISLHHGVQFRASDVKYGSRESPYLALPSDYMGNQLKSYGGYIRYEVNYMGNGRSSNVPDVIITGNGFTLTHKARSQPQPNVNNKIAVQFAAGNWYKPDERMATREEIMMILANVDNILIRLSYIDATEREVELKNIALDSAGLQDYGLGSASLVEHCNCPVGYIGDSCETCAPGYVRQPGGPWLGRCVPFEPQPCAPGTYGDPRRGIPCRECPCPQTGANNFASGCEMSPDGEVTCMCNTGYTGRRCEVCEPGYQGNPLLPGGRCYRIPESSCNAEGTYNHYPNGTCECKPLVVGPRCDTCAPESFHLNAFTYTGCIECFCSGLTKQCSSSSWYRDQISTNFGHSRAQHGFNLIRSYETPNPTPVTFQTSSSALQFSQQSNPDTLYWSLPPQFLGDKITAYGGKMNYTLSYNPLPGGLMSRNNAPDVVIKSGEDLTIIHYRKAGVNPSQPTSYSVPIIESAWQRSDGQIVNREHLLMALSKIKAIYIKATYTTSTKDGTLTHVSLDIANQNNIGQARAVEVEECRCPVGYVGLSCERCAPGYKRDTEAGLYLGVCEPCECNGHSDTCDPETGVCINCADNTEGEFCDRCAPGYIGEASGGTPYDCSPDTDGGEDSYPTPSPQNKTSCSYCDTAGTVSCDRGYCYCKSNVVGARCDQCRPGTFGLSARDPNGCGECYCSGKSTQCRTASLYRQLIPIAFFDNKPLFTDDDGGIADTENLNFDLGTNQYVYSHTSYTPKYWSIRGGAVLGNQLLSYGGELAYNLQVESYGHFESGNDVILIGNGMKLLWSRPAEEQDNPDYRVRLHEDENWHLMDRGQAVRATRLDFMNVLENLEHVLVRATPKIPTTRSSISDFVLETAVEMPMPGAQMAAEVEICTCPDGYTGNSCESCAPMHYRDNVGSCVACPCQEESTSGCSLDRSGYVECQCKSGYNGDRCQNLEDYEQPAATTPRPTPDYQTQITVSIIPPEITIIPVGGSLTLTCTGHLAWNGRPVLVSWYKMGGRLPYNAEEDSGVLRLYDLQIYDSGQYICQAVNNQTQMIFEDKVSITITENSQRTPAKIVQLPTYMNFVEYQASEIACEVSGIPAPSVIWTRVDGQMSRDARTEGDRLIFESPRKSDEGNYRCQATNGVGRDEQYTQVYVQAAHQPQPPARELVYIEPDTFNGEPGQNVRLSCQSTTSITLTYDWSKDGYPVYHQRNVIASGNMLEIREATTQDSGVYTCIGIDQRGRRNYTSDAHVIIEENRPYPGPGPVQPNTMAPTVKRLPYENRIDQGQDFSITCEANGTPYPNIKWTKVHETLADNVHQTGNVLRIINARPENRGMYVCIAESSVGSDQSNTIIDVEPREIPTVDIVPQEPQTVYAGNEASLYCTGNGIPDPTVQWRRTDGKPLSQRHYEESPGYMIIKEVQTDDAGDYECIAENVVGKASGTTVLRVIVPPQITLEPNTEVIQVTEGDELKVVCMATGFPSPTVQWVDADQENSRMSPTGVQYNQAYLEINRVSRNDAKVYKCIATNEAGIDESYMTIQVNHRRGDAPDDSDVDRVPYEPRHQPMNPYEPPHQPMNPYEPTHQEMTPYEPPQNVYRANAGDEVKLFCDLMSTQTPSETIPYLITRWERVDGRPLPENSYLDRNSLIISRVEEQNSGKYRCNALDNRGTVVTFVVAELVLVPIPHITFHPKMPIVVTANDNIDIYCEVTGEEPIYVSWHTDNNRPLPPSVHIDGNYLRFVSITPADAGRYYCSASNHYGNTTNMAEVVVNRGHTYERQPQAKRYNITEGEDVALNCDVQQGREPIRGEINFNWRREDGRELPSHAYIRNQVLYLRGVHKQDEGRYVCESYSTAGGSSPPSYVDLFIKPGVPLMRPAYVPPTPPVRPRDLSLKLDQQHSKLRSGEATEVECYTSDNSYSDIVWERADGEPLPPHIQQIGNRLIISHVTAADAGNYVCKCKTDEGDLYTTSYELEIDETQHEWKRPKMEHANVGSMAKLSCDADASAGRPSYRWSRQYGQMQSGRDIWGEHLTLNDIQANDAGTYICTTTTPDRESIDYPTILVVTGAIPQFHQDPVSYMAFPTLPDSYIKFNFDITFRPEEGNGLLLFNGQKRGSGDYIALSLKDRYPEFRFDFDGKPMIVRAEHPVTLNEWHTIHVNRFRRDGYMQVDEQHPVAFPTLAQISPLDLIEDLYIGGVPNWEVLPHDAVDQQVGFVGCISRLTLQGTIVELMKETKFKEGITACQPCQENPCENSGICLESQTEMAYTCICQQGWTGRNCAVEGTQCTPGICGAGRCENTEHGMECLCPLNKTGDRCQYIEHLNEQSLAFKTNSYAAYGTPRASKLNIKFQVRPNTLEDAVLLYTAESKLPSGDFVAVLLHDGHVELIINTGARLKPVMVKSLNPLPLNKWTEIEISRRFGEGILRVGDDPEVKGKASNLARTLYIKTPMYIGGYDHKNVKLNRIVNITSGFDGCISNLHESQRKINLIADIEDAANIQNCGEINEIDEEESFDNYEQLKHTEKEMDPCSSDPCENGGTCIVHEEAATCTCSLGFTGKHCEEHITLKNNASFHGNGYLEIDRNQFHEDIEQKYSFAAMVFSTKDPNGLLLWWGQKSGEEYIGQDFLALAIVDGIVEFSFRLNGEETVIRNPDNRVDDGRRHIVLIKRTDNTAMLELDHLLDAGETRPTGKDTMSLPGNVFIGGIPDIAKFTGGRYTKNFNGCVHVIEGESTGIIQLGSVAVSGVNVDTCPYVDESLEAEPPVV